MSTGPVVAFADHDPESPGLAVRVNFGILTGREATPAEIDSLAQALLPEVDAVSIVAEDRHVIGEHAESSLHQVVIEVDEDLLPESVEDIDALSARLVEEAVRWVDSCVAERNVEIG